MNAQNIKILNVLYIIAILSIYMTSKLGMSEHQATNWFHVYIFLVYFAPIFGGLLADSWLGKFK